jgi:hypothetical protein
MTKSIFVVPVVVPVACATGTAFGTPAIVSRRTP